MNMGPLQLQGGVMRQDFRILEEVDIATLRAADGGLRLVKNELLASEGTGGDIEPAIFERAFDQAHGDAGGHAEQAKADGAADRSAMAHKGDGIEDDTADECADGATEDAVGSFFGGLPDDAVDDATGSAEDHPCKATHHPEGRIVIGANAHLEDDGEADAIKNIRADVEAEPQRDAEG